MTDHNVCVLFHGQIETILSPFISMIWIQFIFLSNIGLFQSSNYLSMLNLNNFHYIDLPHSDPNSEFNSVQLNIGLFQDLDYWNILVSDNSCYYLHNQCSFFKLQLNSGLLQTILFLNPHIINIHVFFFYQSIELSED